MTLGPFGLNPELVWACGVGAESELPGDEPMVGGTMHELENKKLTSYASGRGTEMVTATATAAATATATATSSTASA